MSINNGEEIEQVSEFFYMGSLISDDAKCNKEIKKKIAMGKEVLTKRKELLKGGLNRDIKKRMVKALIGYMERGAVRSGDVGDENGRRQTDRGFLDVDSGGDLAPSLGGRKHFTQTKISERRFFRKKFP